MNIRYLTYVVTISLIPYVMIPFATAAHATIIDKFYLKIENIDGGIKRPAFMPKEYESIKKIGDQVVVDKKTNYSIGLYNDSVSTNIKEASYSIVTQIGDSKRKIESISAVNLDYAYLSVYANDDNLTFFNQQTGFFYPRINRYMVSKTLYIYNKNKGSFGKLDFVNSSVRKNKDGTFVDPSDGYDDFELKNISYDTERKLYLVKMNVNFNNKQWQGKSTTFTSYTKDSSFYLRLNEKDFLGMKCIPIPKSIVTCTDDGVNIHILPVSLY